MTIAHPATIGIEAASLETWLRNQPGDEAQLAIRTEIITHQRDDVLALLPGAEPGVCELGQHLANRDGLSLPAQPFDILAALGRTYAEDICVLTPQAEQYILSGAILCFPNRWRLCDKVGKPIIAVHDPVPDYAGQLSNQVDFFLTRLRPGRCFRRSNWGLVSTPTLHLPAAAPPVNPTRDADFYMRQEEQAFVKLPNTGAVIFTIRTTVTAWAEVPAPTREAILAQTGQLSPEWLAYKSIRPSAQQSR
ncbi:MAG: DUF3445 domain-containing protein [Rhodospirillaceae bacterium]|nr:DUF3445 domain-containing protein [Rhodospirillaceae bacterium]